MPTKKSKDKDYLLYANILTDIWARKLKIKRPGLYTDYKKWLYEHRCYAKDNDMWGQMCDQCYCMYIDISHHIPWRIMETVVHELLHFKYPELDDGPKFEKLVTKTLMGKKR